MVGLCTSLSAQSRKEARWASALLALEKSDFAVQYKAIKDTIESQVAEFHFYKSSLTPDQIAEVRKAYELSVAEFDKILNEVKVGFTDPHKRDLIADHADYYSRMLSGNLNDALKYYNTTCKSKIDLYVDNEKGVLGLMEIGILITLGKEIWSLWDQNNKKSREMSAQYFEEHFSGKFRFKKWEHY